MSHEIMGNAEKLAELKAIFKEKMADADRAKRMQKYNANVSAVNDLRSKHGDEIENYELFHIIASSTPDPGLITGFDLPDREIESYIRSL